jgi:hypothetical protein
MHFQAPDYVEALARYHPMVAYHAIGDYPVPYESIDFEQGMVSKQELASNILMLAKERLATRTRADAEAARVRITTMILGTSDPQQLKSYEVKYAEALILMSNRFAPSTQIEAEAVITGENVLALAQMVKAQYEAVQNALKPHYGRIDGLRRVTLTQIQAATALSDLVTLPDVSWGV